MTTQIFEKTKWLISNTDLVFRKVKKKKQIKTITLMQTLLDFPSVLLHFLSYRTFNRVGAALSIKEKGNKAYYKL